MLTVQNQWIWRGRWSTM